MVRFRICLSYDGTDFFGWQRQATGDPTIQGVLEKCLSQIYGTPIAVVASGRTDRGVHALNQWAHFDLPPETNASQLQFKLNRMTPESVFIKCLELCPGGFHAQISALSKCYKYRILPVELTTPFPLRYCWNPHKPLNIIVLQSYAPIFLGEHDFSSFQSQGTPVRSPVRKILISRWVKKKSGILEYQVKGSGFLKQMVRNMVGTMLKLEQLQASAKELEVILGARDRSLAAAPAPPQGLFLSSVQYPQSLDNKCRKL